MFINTVSKDLIPDLPRPLLRALGLVPPRIATKKRLESFPTEGLPIEQPVVVRWNQYQVPYIEAQSDDDLAFTLGLIHSHLRGSHISLMRLVARGRLSELAGPLAKEIDYALRLLDFPRATEQMFARMPPDTQRWITRFVDGLNHYQSLGLRRSREMRLIGLKTEPWTISDVLTVGRLMGADYNWLTFLTLLPERKEDSFADLWRHILEAGGGLSEDGISKEPAIAITKRLVSAGRAGSNSVAVAPKRSMSGAGMVATDTHLGLAMPNIWLMAGLKSPSMEVVGLMLSGLPFVCIGRTPHLAWGGTNLRAAGTDLYDVSSLPDDEIETEVTTIKMRFRGTTQRTIRRTRFGPILSDAPFFPGDKDAKIAMRWVGHEATDEVTPFLSVARARTPEEFRAAFARYGVPSQNMVFADKEGNIGQIIATTLPIRRHYPDDDFVRDATDPAEDWDGFVEAEDMPHILNPREGVLVSANNKPPPSPVPVGFNFDAGDRLNRMYDLLNSRVRISTEDLETFLCDASSPRAAGIAKQLGARIEELELGVDEAALARRLLDWDGDYAIDSSGAVAFETLLANLVPLITDGSALTGFTHYQTQWAFFVAHFQRIYDELEPARRDTLLGKAASQAARDAARHRTWGDMHRVKVAHILGSVPLIGRAFSLGDIPSEGSRQTLFKSSHGLVKDRHFSDFGSMARHISDLADEDANWFVLFGGQDDWIGSESFADQVPLWQERRYIRMPLRPESVAADFPHVTTMKPH